MHDREQILSTCVISNTKTNHLLKIAEIMLLVVTLIMLCCCWSCWSWCSWWWSHLHYLEAAWLIACAGRERSRNYSEVCSIVQCSPGPENWRGEVDFLWRCFYIFCVNLCVCVVYLTAKKPPPRPDRLENFIYPCIFNRIFQMFFLIFLSNLLWECT